MYTRDITKAVQVGNICIGGSSNVIIQSMTNTKTRDIEATVNQIHKLENAGCQIVRVAVLTFADAEAIREIKKHINIPIVADIHFDYKLALKSIASGADKIRINPGNIGSDENVKAVVDACKEKKIPIRIGINSGSIEKHILEHYKKPTPEAMVASAKYHVELLEKYNFYDIIISLKASNVLTTIEANRLAAQTFPYPLHLGITEAGTDFSGTISSSIGLGILLSQGIGSTIRVSLTAEPEKEIHVAKEILANLNLYKKPKLVSCPTCGRIQYNMIPIVQEIELFLQTIQKDITVAIMGCVVNGPGEAKEANIAVAGGKDEALLFIDGVKQKKIKQENLVQVLKQVILDY
ncbi:flavodoxin-dependent (E)-4-hydroxy-3-methylbut-2-enyl-diphosphate synthase [Hujiaoplasma nucleasis]|uniref:4-hydroxy-3-methylbut-2-en-1-yl diphosphate synthase (flavodoxin) n=1 Tax=Hujiaoplasma nucleasis TaxID=2725268 RepID=A0A7L6MZV9_9MOLU|nr:flavodoxin-dependent (E)-4-hydroxy-3-methylbut-2-enyl-diphosphate synthase [Hujiaoplasma nucleasis]QLY39523.1 flavodoxin-dependent (E)-4-hydroxy-3-methylbut-2-enyl-diphosphate synthase [Hujiaoplasma nucleasis]